MDRNNTVIMSCSSLIVHVNAAQKKMGTAFKVIPLDKRLHAEPREMRNTIIKTMEALPNNIDTVLVSMGFCGGSWRDVLLKHKVVIPRVDDCITLLLHNDEKQHSNLKEKEHLYFRDGDDKTNTFISIREKIYAENGTLEGDRLFKSWFDTYTNLNIVDTGAYDCHGQSFVKTAEENAKAIGCQLGWTTGSNIILEKLVSGNWGEQFFIGEPNTNTSCLEYLDSFNNERK